MSSLGLLRPPQSILFGKGQRRALGAIARSLGSRAFVCTDGRLSSDADFLEMMEDLKANGVAVRVFDETAAELPLTCLDACIAAAAGFDPDVVIGIGGGSCMDLGKAAAVMLTHGGHIRDYYGELKVPGALRPLISIPTTAGTGSEVSPVAVLSDPEIAMKVGIASPYLVSHTAICDPELTYSCPPALTSISGCDALTHAIEAYTAIQRPMTAELSHERVFVGKNILSDHYALRAIELISRSLLQAQANDEAARDDVMLAALCAGLAFGTAGTAAAHAIQYPVGALTHTAHGTGVALMLPFVMDFNRPARVAEYAQIALAMGATRDGRTDETLSRVAIEAVADLLAKAGIPRTLADIGVEAEQLQPLAEQSFTAQRLVNNNPVPLGVDSLLAIVKAAHAGTILREAA